MGLVKVNLTIDGDVWERFGKLAPNRQKSRIVNELLKEQIRKMTREKEERELVLAFQDASKDQGRLTDTEDWEVLDSEGWD